MPADTPSVLLGFKLLLLIGVANGAALFGHTLLRERWAWPIDGNWRFIDGRPLLGPSKTVRGVLLAVVATVIAGVALEFPPAIGIAIGAFAMVGDAISSFIKRRLNIPPHGQAPGIDQIPESLFPLLAVQPYFGLRFLDIAVLVAIFWILELALSRVLYRLKLRDQPY